MLAGVVIAGAVVLMLEEPAVKDAVEDMLEDAEEDAERVDGGRARAAKVMVI